MSTPISSQLNIKTRSSVSNSRPSEHDHENSIGSYNGYPPTPTSQNGDSPTPNNNYKNKQIIHHKQHYSNSMSGNRKDSGYNINNNGNNNQSWHKKVHLDVSGEFPYFENQTEEKKITIHRKNSRKHRHNKLEEFEKRDLTKEEILNLEKLTLSKYGYIRKKFIATTLQGEVFLGKKIENNKECVIKKTSKKLHKLGITITKSGKRIKVQENIVAEAELMQTFMNNNPPSSMIEYYDFFEDDFYFYLIMENGGSDYFDFIVKCHELISLNKLSLSEWRKHCKFMFAQMVQFIRWMHETMHCCNLDVSLENMLIRDCAYYDEESKTLKKCYIKFIDFGLTEFFNLKTNPYYQCQKYVGKTHYKAPKVYNKKEIFSANRADIWSLGVCLFMMIIGAPPYNKPIDKDITFQYIKYKQIAKLLQEWGRIKYVTSNLHDLLTKMLTFDESKRITINEIVRHPWIKHYFPNDNKPQNITPKPNKQPSLPPKLSISTDHSHMLAARDVPPSPSYSQQSVSISVSNNNNNIKYGANAKLNIMIPSQAVSSMSGSVYHTPSVSRSHNASRSRSGSYINNNNNRKYSQPYSPYSPHSVHSQQNNNTPTPIVQSATSKHDQAAYIASIEAQKQQQQQHHHHHHNNNYNNNNNDDDGKTQKNIKYKRKKAVSDIAARKSSNSNVSISASENSHSYDDNHNNKKDKKKSRKFNKKRKSSKDKKKSKSKKFFKLNLPLFGN